MGIRDFIRDFGILLGFSEKPNSRIKSRIPSQVEPLPTYDTHCIEDIVSVLNNDEEFLAIPWPKSNCGIYMKDLEVYKRQPRSGSKKTQTCILKAEKFMQKMKRKIHERAANMLVKKKKMLVGE